MNNSNSNSKVRQGGNERATQTVHTARQVVSEAANAVSLKQWDWNKQRGAALLVMLLILVVGAAAVLLNALNSAAVRLARQAQTQAALAFAKDALVGRALSNANMPASLPCPDLVTNIAGNNVPNDGVADLLSGNNCPSFIGHFPWRTLGLGDVRDGAGERLWYVLSPSMRDDESARSLNSDTIGQLSLQDGTPQTGLVALIFAANAPLDGQVRIAANENNVVHYLEGENANGDWIFSQQTTSPQFNDEAIGVTATALFRIVEQRVLREIRFCLDDYAAASGGKYPWASPLTDTAHYFGSWNTYFGRIPAQPNVLVGAVDAKTASFVDALVAAQIALNNYDANNSGTTRSALSLAAAQLKTAAQQAIDPVNPAAQTAALQAADFATSLSKKAADAGAAVIQLQLNQTQTQINLVRGELVTAGLIDASMALGWTRRCTAFSEGYWESWKNLLFYQVAKGFQPNGAGACGTGCLTINGNGQYRAVVINASKVLAGQSRGLPTALNAFLETQNQHQPADAPPLNFVTYKADDVANYTSNNDQVLCLDGRQSCK